MQAVLNDDMPGLKFPGAWLQAPITFLVILLSGILAAIVFGANSPGSAVALCFLLPFGLTLLQWQGRVRRWHDHALPLMATLALFGVALEPGFLNVSLTWLLLVATALAARSTNPMIALPLLGGIGRTLGLTPKSIFADALVVTKLAGAQATQLPRLQLTAVLLPLVAVGTFALLLASANPVIENLLLALDLDQPLRWTIDLLNGVFSWTGFVFACTILLLWPVLRGETTIRPRAGDAGRAAPLWHQLFFRPATVVATLFLLNLMFAAENALDVWHVWLKAELPQGMSHAEYVHRGSYTLIVTAILAGLLMVFALWKGTATEQSSRVRWLVYAWTLQNLLLVASSAKRTLDYIDAYGWTEWRLAGLLWMGLVFLGLASIIWRVARNRDSRWLVDVNLIAASLLLLFCAVVDMRGFIAQANVSQAVGDPSRQLDFDYLVALGPASLPAITSYEKRLRLKLDAGGRPEPLHGTAVLVTRSAIAGSRLRSALNADMQDWRSWMWRFAWLPETFRP